MADTSTIRRIPGATDVTGPVSLRPSGVNPAIDVAAPYEGAQALAAGIGSAGQSLENIGNVIEKRQRTAEVAKADAAWLSGSLDIGNKYQGRTDYTKFDAEAPTDTAKVRDAAAALITDPETRQQWLDQTELKRISLVDAIKDRGTELKQADDRVKLTDSVDALTKVISDPMTPQVVRDDARKQVAANIAFGKSSGLLTADQASKMADIGLRGADQQLALNRARLGIEFGDPQKVFNRLGVPTEAGGAGLVAGVQAANGGKLELDPELAKVTADLLGDANFPTDPKLAKAYLSDPAKAQEYAAAATAMLNDRYKGDLTATVVALDPEGGTTLADRWVKSGHDESVLPAAVRKRYREAMVAFKPAISGDRIPLEASSAVDLNNIDVDVLDRVEQMQTAFGEAVPILPPDAKSQHVDARTVSLDMSGLSDERRSQLVQMASSMGFTGVGINKDTLTLDTGEVRTWGDAPPWAKDALAAHQAGTLGDVPLLYGGVDPIYAALDFDQRLQLAAQAKQAMKERSALDQASLGTIADDAPAAIANTGKYEGDLPDAARFVKAYGAADGIERYRAFEASLDTARTIYGFRAEPADQIMAAVAAAAPRSSGQGAALESKQYDAIAAAADQTLKARAADPSGYTMNVFPKVAEAFSSAGNDPKKFAAALDLMATAQDILGIETPELLPKGMAATAAQQFNDPTLSAGERINAVAGLMLRTADEGQQLAIFKQLVGAGVPEYTQGAVAAMARGDVGGAQNLMRAALIDPEKLAGQLPSNIKPADIDGAVQSKIFDDGAIGDLVYGVSDGSADNLARVRADSTLINRDVRLHLIDGSAGGDLNKAIDLTIKDMYGDIQPIVARGVKITLPANVDPQPMLAGFDQLHGAVRTALQQDMANGLVQVMGRGDVDMRSTGMAAIYKAGIDNALDVVMSEGYFVNAGDDRYQFFNPYTGAVIGDDKGNALTFSKSDVLAAAQGAPSSAGLPPDNPNVTPDRLRTIYGSNFDRPARGY